jgi:hypothetical protein
MQSSVWQKAITGLVWLALGFCVVAWAMHVRGIDVASASRAPAVAQSPSRPQPDFNAMLRALNAGAPAPVAAAAPAAPPASSRFQVKGVALGGSQSAVLLSVDGQSAKPFVVGAEVLDGWVLRSASRQQVVLTQGTGGARMELPVPAPSP